MNIDFKKYCNSHGLRFNLSESRVRNYMIDEFGSERYGNYENEMHLRREFTSGNSHNYEFNTQKKLDNISFNSDKIYGFPNNFDESISLMLSAADPLLAASSQIIDFFQRNDFNHTYDIGCYNALLVSFLATSNPSKRFYGIDTELKILEFSKDKFSGLNNLDLIGGNILDINLSNADKADFIYSSFGFNPVDFKNSYDTHKIREDINYKNAFDLYKSLFQSIENVSHSDSIFMPLLRIGTCENFISFIDAATTYKWTLIEEELKPISWFDTCQSKSEAIPHIILKKTEQPITYDNHFYLRAIKNIFTKDLAFESRLLFDNIKNSKTIIQSNNLENDKVKLYVEIGNPDVHQQKLYAFISFELGNVIYKEFDELEELDNFMRESGFVGS